MGADTQAPARGRSVEHVREGYLGALLDSDLAGARAVLDDAIAQEHLATAATQSMMARLAESLADGTHRVSPGTAVVACASDELHAVGGQALSGSAERARRTGADAYAPDAEAAVAVAAVRERFASPA
jgi:methanogenic corrinoid protein MtbC1